MFINHEKLTLVSVKLPCEYEGEDISLTCNGTYMLDAIKALGCEKVLIEFSGFMKPIKVSNPEDASVLMILVPIRSYD